MITTQRLLALVEQQQKRIRELTLAIGEAKAEGIAATKRGQALLDVADAYALSLCKELGVMLGKYLSQEETLKRHRDWGTAAWQETIYWKARAISAEEESLALRLYGNRVIQRKAIPALLNLTKYYPSRHD